MNEPIILEMGIDLCLNCPYPDCVGTDTELCHYMKDEVARVRAEIAEQKKREKREMLTNIQNSVNGNGGLTISELCEKYGYEYKELQSFGRRGILRIERKKVGKKTRLIVIGVDKDYQAW